MWKQESSGGGSLVLDSHMKRTLTVVNEFSN